MLDRKLIREQPEIIRRMLQDRHLELDLQALLDLEARRLEITNQVEKLKAERNQASEHIAQKKKQKAEKLCTLSHIVF